MAELQPLLAVRINRVFRALQDQRVAPTANLLFSARTPITDASDSEILGKWVDRIQIADIITDDSEAVVYNAGRMIFETYSIPKIKHGTFLSESQLRELRAFQRGGGAAGDLYRNIERRILTNLLVGIAQRREALIIGSYLDTFNYDRLGMKISASWGIPADLKINVSPAWTSPGTATPIQNIFDLQRLAQVKYGTSYNRMTMSRAAFELMIATTEFQSKARVWLAPNVSFVNLTLSNIDPMRRLAEQVTGMQIEFYDARYWSQNADGTRTSANFLPLDKVIFTNTANDNDPMVSDWARGELIESIAADIFQSDVKGGIPVRGPAAYATGNGNLNPPNVAYWAVDRGFPRRHVLESSAWFDVGTVTDSIPVDDTYLA